MILSALQQRPLVRAPGFVEGFLMNSVQSVAEASAFTLAQNLLYLSLLPMQSLLIQQQYVLSTCS